MSSNDKNQGKSLLRKLSLAALLLAVVVVVLGAYTRLVDAGLGCPDWPGCYGFLVVPHTDAHIEIAEQRYPDAPVEAHKGWAEMTHRYVAGCLLLLIAAITVTAVRRRQEPGMPVKLAAGLLVLVICQALFGMWTVTLKLWPQVVTAHLLGGFATLSLLLVLNLCLRPRPIALASAPRAALRAIQPWALTALILVILQIALGGWTSSNYAALACPDFPTCQEKYWPEMDFAHGFNVFQHVGPNYLGGLMENEGRVAIHVTHRIGALVVLAVLSLLLWRLWRVPGGRVLRPVAATVAAALLLQVSLGLSNIIWLLPLPVAVAHNAGGALLLLSVIWLNERLLAATRQEPATDNNNERYVHESNGTVSIHH